MQDIQAKRFSQQGIGDVRSECSSPLHGWRRGQPPSDVRVVKLRGSFKGFSNYGLWLSTRLWAAWGLRINFAAYDEVEVERRGGLGQEVPMERGASCSV